jgi:predicted DNA-binding transcriptional regulator YafY/predicted kinase
MQKTVIINRGIPASGKSTFSKNIVSTLRENGINAISCSTDDFFMSEGKYLFDFTKLREYHLKNQNRFNTALKDNIELVICDNTNIEPWEAKPYYIMAKIYDYKVILIDFKARDISLHYKSQDNDDYAHNIPLDILENMKNSYTNYKALIEKTSYPTSEQPKREYIESSGKVEVFDELSEPFYYDSLIKISADDYLKVKNIIGDMILKKIRDYSLNEIKLIPNHYKIIMKEFKKRPDKSLTAYDFEDIIPKDPKQIERYIKELQSEFHNIIDVKIGRKNAYKLIDNFDIFIEAFQNTEDIDELFYLAEESNPKLFQKLEYQTRKNNDIFLFKSSIFEMVENKEVFNHLKDAIKSNEYREIKFFDNSLKYEVKCIKLVFVDNNWYLAYIESNGILKLGRVSFIEKAKYASKKTYQKKSIAKHLKHLKDNLQNSMTLFDQEIKVAKIQATPAISKYFEKDMKKFFSSQKYIKRGKNTSVIFSINYTQDLEILPFIQKWLPDLIILEPQALKDAYSKKLEKTLKNLKEVK